MTFAADMAALNAAVLDELESVPVTYAPETGSAVTVQALWVDDDALQDSDFTTIDEAGPSVVFRLSDLPGIDPRADAPIITRDGQEYTVWHRDLDSETGGTVRLWLHRRLS